MNRLLNSTQIARLLCLGMVALLLAGCVSGVEQDAAKPAPATSVAVNPINVDPQEYLHSIRLPEGFRISIYASGVKGARSMTMGSQGTLFVGTRTDAKRKPMGTVYAITNPGRDDVAGEVITLAQGLNVPNGVVFHEGDLYVGELNRIIRYDNIEEQLRQPPAPQVIDDTFPNKMHHGWKYLGFGPDGRLYVTVGAPCNTCVPESGQGVIMSMRADGSDKKTVALGIRNSVGFDWQPDSGELWFTDNGRDIWGDDIPPEELNRVTAVAQHFGFPYRYGKNLVDEEYQTGMAAGEFTAPALEFPAHNALLGMRFYGGSQFPAAYKGDIFIASHGSWNRAIPDGYRIFRVKMRDGRATGAEVFASGWLTENHKYWGRPVDILALADGSLLVSDDHAGVIYRVSYAP
jgi:glucose/arabinose dehydrogenase